MDVHTTGRHDGALRRRVVETALVLFRTRGIKAVTMDDIAHALTISKRTLYLLFTDKEELLLEGLKLGRIRERQEMEATLAESPNVLNAILEIFDHRMQELEHTVPAFFTDMSKYRTVTEFFDRCSEADAEEAVAFLRQGVEQGLFRQDIDFDIFYRLLVGQIAQIFNNLLSRDYDVRTVFINIVPVCLRGCATPAGQQLIDAFLERYRK